MKKVLSLVMTMVLLLTMVPVHGVHAVEQEVVADVPMQAVSSADGDLVVERGSEIQFTITLDEVYEIRSCGVSVSYDSSVLEYVGGEWLISGFMTNVNDSTQQGALAYTTLTKVTGDIFVYTFRVLDAAAFGEYDVIFDIIMKGNAGADIFVPDDEQKLTVSDHIYNAVVTEPTCTEGGYTEFSCTLCGDCFVGDYTEPIGHSWSDWYMIQAPTCENYGLEGRSCHCGEMEQNTINPLGHDYEGVITDPNCTEDGFTTYTCRRCSDVYVSDYTEALGHQIVMMEGYPATCTMDGLTTGAYCYVCGVVLSEQQIIPAFGHSYTVIIHAAPTTENTGSATVICVNCGEEFILELPALNAIDYTYGIVLEPTYTETGIGCFTWNNQSYGELRFEVILDKAIMPSDSLVTVGSVKGKSGEIVEVVLTLSDALDLRSLGLHNFTYDSENLTLIGAEWLLEGSVLNSWDAEHQMAAIAYMQDTNLNGEIFKLTFQIHEDAPEGEYLISCEATAKIKPDGKEITVAVANQSGCLTVKNYVPGDADGNEIVDTDDAIYLLYYTLFGESVYPISQPCDYDGNGVVDTDDAIYLLYHTLFGSDLYPLN